MPVTVAMYDKAFEETGGQLNALGLDITVHTFGRDGKFLIDGVATAPEEVDVDYLWLSNHIYNGDF